MSAPLPKAVVRRPSRLPKPTWERTNVPLDGIKPLMWVRGQIRVCANCGGGFIAARRTSEYCTKTCYCTAKMRARRLREQIEKLG